MFQNYEKKYLKYKKKIDDLKGGSPPTIGMAVNNYQGNFIGCIIYIDKDENVYLYNPEHTNKPTPANFKIIKLKNYTRNMFGSDIKDQQLSVDSWMSYELKIYLDMISNSSEFNKKLVNVIKLLTPIFESLPSTQITLNYLSDKLNELITLPVLKPVLPLVPETHLTVSTPVSPSSRFRDALSAIRTGAKKAISTGAKKSEQLVQPDQLAQPKDRPFGGWDVVYPGWEEEILLSETEIYFPTRLEQLTATSNRKAKLASYESTSTTELSRSASSGSVIKVIFIRHGDRSDMTDNPADIIIYDKTGKRIVDRPYDPSLSKIGIRNTIAKASILRKFNIEQIVSSPFLRCVQTSCIIYNKLHMRKQIILDRGICEKWTRRALEFKQDDEFLNFKKIERPIDELYIIEPYPTKDMLYLNDKTSFPINEETPDMTNDRYLRQSKRIIKEQFANGIRTLLIVTHGDCLNSIVHDITKKYIMDISPLDFITVDYTINNGEIDNMVLGECIPSLTYAPSDTQSVTRSSHPLLSNLFD